MPNEPKSPAQEALERIETEIDAGRIFLRRSVANVPYIIFQADVAGNELLELRGRCAKEMLTDFIWRQTKRLLKKSDLESVTTALCGRAASCPRGGIPDPELMRLIDSEPILAVVWEWTAAEAALRSAYPLVIESSMSELCKTLGDFAKKRELGRLPRQPNVLSCKLNQYRPVFEALGIKITIRRSNGAKVVIEWCADDDGLTPSAKRPAVTP